MADQLEPREVVAKREAIKNEMGKLSAAIAVWRKALRSSKLSPQGKVRTQEMIAIAQKKLDALAKELGEL